MMVCALSVLVCLLSQMAVLLLLLLVVVVLLLLLLLLIVLPPLLGHGGLLLPSRWRLVEGDGGTWRRAAVGGAGAGVQ